MVFVTGTIDTNDSDAKSIGMALTNEKSITLYVRGKTGDHDRHEVGLEISGNGTDFITLPQRVIGSGVMTIQHNAAHVNAKVFKTEGKTSTITVDLLAR